MIAKRPLKSKRGLDKSFSRCCGSLMIAKIYVSLRVLFTWREDPGANLERRTCLCMMSLHNGPKKQIKNIKKISERKMIDSDFHVEKRSQLLTDVLPHAANENDHSRDLVRGSRFAVLWRHRDKPRLTTRHRYTASARFSRSLTITLKSSEYLRDHVPR